MDLACDFFICGCCDEAYSFPLGFSIGQFGRIRIRFAIILCKQSVGVSWMVYVLAPEEECLKINVHGYTCSPLKDGLCMWAIIRKHDGRWEMGDGRWGWGWNWRDICFRLWLGISFFLSLPPHFLLSLSKHPISVCDQSSNEELGYAHISVSGIQNIKGSGH